VVTASKMAITVIIYSPRISTLNKLKIVELRGRSNVSLLIPYNISYAGGY
jgi:hypothetical protein